MKVHVHQLGYNKDFDIETDSAKYVFNYRLSLTNRIFLSGCVDRSYESLIIFFSSPYFIESMISNKKL